jgi:hypothetical protein
MIIVNFLLGIFLFLLKNIGRVIVKALTKESVIQVLKERKQTTNELYSGESCCFLGACGLAAGVKVIRNCSMVDEEDNLVTMLDILSLIPLSIRLLTLDQVLTVNLDPLIREDIELLKKKEGGNYKLGVIELNDDIRISFENFIELIERYWNDN